MTESVQFEHWNEYLYRLGAVCTPAELHGLLCGFLCGATQASQRQWLQLGTTAMDCPDELDETATEALGAMYELTLRSLQDEQLGWRPMLPDDALPLAERIRALSQWCAAFLRGYGHAGGDAADGEMQEAIADLAQIAELDDAAEESNSNEVYFSELTEYVRVVVMNLFAQSHSGAEPNEGSAKIH